MSYNYSFVLFMPVCMDPITDSRFTTQRFHYGKIQLHVLSIVGGRKWQHNSNNISRIKYCRNQAWNTRNKNNFDLAIYLLSPPSNNNNPNSATFELPTFVFVELSNLMKEIASYQKKVTILVDKNINDIKASYHILFMANHLDIIRGLELGSRICPRIFYEIMSSNSLVYFGIEHMTDVVSKDGISLAGNQSIQNVYLNLPHNNLSILDDGLIRLARELKENTCIKNLSVATSSQEWSTNAFAIFKAIDNHPSIRCLTLTYSNEMQIHNAMIKYLVPLLTFPTCNIVELELSAGASHKTIIQNPSFLIDLLCPALGQNKSLRRLSLLRCRLSTQDVDSMLCRLLKNTSSKLAILDLEHNNVKSFEFDEFLHLAKQQKQNRATFGLQELRLRNNPIHTNCRNMTQGFFSGQALMLCNCPDLYSFGWEFDSLWDSYRRLRMQKQSYSCLKELRQVTPSYLEAVADINKCHRINAGIDMTQIHPKYLPLILQQVKKEVKVFFHNKRQANTIYHLLLRNPALLDNRWKTN